MKVLGGPSSENRPGAKGQILGILLRALNTRNSGRVVVASTLPSIFNSLKGGGWGLSPIPQEKPRVLGLAFRDREGLEKTQEGLLCSSC